MDRTAEAAPSDQEPDTGRPRRWLRLRWRKRPSLLDLAGSLSDEEADELTEYVSRLRGYPISTTS